jgi:hypothetical protein
MRFNYDDFWGWMEVPSYECTCWGEILRIIIYVILILFYFFTIFVSVCGSILLLVWLTYYTHKFILSIFMF